MNINQAVRMANADVHNKKPELITLQHEVNRLNRKLSEAGEEISKLKSKIEYLEQEKIYGGY